MLNNFGKFILVIIAVIPLISCWTGYSKLNNLKESAFYSYEHASISSKLLIFKSTNSNHRSVHLNLCIFDESEEEEEKDKAHSLHSIKAKLIAHTSISFCYFFKKEPFHNKFKYHINGILEKTKEPYFISYSSLRI